MEPLAEQLGLRLELAAGYASEPEWVGDPDHLERILLNLLSNACKFSNPGGVVTLSVEEDAGEVVLRVRDRGVGVAPEHRERIFERFFQVESGPRRRFEGTGVGLAIVKELVELHRGRVTVESEPGVGTTFTVRLPRAQASAPAPSPARSIPRDDEHGEAPRTLPAAVRDATRAPPDATVERAPEVTPGRGRAPGPGDLPRRRLLVIEDQVDLLDFLVAELGDEYEVGGATGGREGLSRALAEPPDLVLSDVMLPMLDGVELLRELRADERTREVPILLMSARGDIETRLGAFWEGADDYIQKPFELRELRARIRLQLRLRSQKEALARRNEELTRLSSDLAAALHRVEQAEETVVRTEKLATLGTVVAGVAHEINNPLHFAAGNVTLLRRTIDRAQAREGEASPSPSSSGDGPDPRELLDDLGASLSRIAGVTEALLQLASRRRGAVEDVDLPRLFDLIARMLASQIPTGVRLHASLTRAPRVRAVSQELFQVLLNLFQNAIQAVGERGEVALESRALPGGDVELVVRDDGPGIPPELRGRIFEPFFTTRPAGQGTGLGLSIVEKLVTASGGSVRVRSAEPRGTEFVVRLPQQSRDAEDGAPHARLH
jgi:signal transduction histidine kinase